MTETLEIIYLVCGIAAMLAAAVAMTIISVRGTEGIKRIRESSKRDARLFEYQKQALDHIVAREEAIKTIDDGKEQQSKEE